MSGLDSLIASLEEGGYLKTPRIRAAFRAIGRADFVLPEYKGEAYGNYPLPIGQDQTISQPLTVAFLLELLDPKPDEKILDIGSGSGWTTALLAEIVGPEGKVFGMERIPELCRLGETNVRKYNFVEKGTVKFFCRDGTDGLPEEAPFDKILAGAAASREIPQAWRDELKPGGKIVAPVDGSVWRFTKREDGSWEEEEHPGFAFVPLVGESEAKAETPAERLLTLLFVLGTLAGAVLANEIFLPHPPTQGAKAVIIAPGLGSRKIADLLGREGIIRSPETFVLWASLLGKSYQLKPGAYTFDAESISGILKRLVRGGANEWEITIPEGWSTREIARYLEGEGITPAEKFLKIATSPPTALPLRFPFLNGRPKGATLEGYLFPDTYRIFKDATTEDIVFAMLANFGKKVSPLAEEIRRQKKSIYEIVTMASLIEEEVRKPEERALVSGILWKRLALGIPLQVDATITYLKRERGDLNVKNPRISREDLGLNSPYNTYRSYGLPKGPIANPGLDAIQRALSPKESPYLYYLSDRDGRTVFSKTLEEHNTAKAKYLR